MTPSLAVRDDADLLLAARELEAAREMLFVAHAVIETRPTTDQEIALLGVETYR